VHHDRTRTRTGSEKRVDGTLAAIRHRNDLVREALAPYLTQTADDLTGDRQCVGAALEFVWGDDDTRLRANSLSSTEY
jgi:hypothetical protein